MNFKSFVIVIICIVGDVLTVSYEKSHVDISRLDMKINPKTKWSNIEDQQKESKKANPTLNEEPAVLKTYKPREDPKLFYFSESYIQEMKHSPSAKEVSSVYPGRNVFRADDPNYLKPHSPMSMRLTDRRRYNSIRSEKRKICIRCPGERTLVAKEGLDRVVLHKPRLLTCSKQRAPTTVRFVHKDGPDFGSLIEFGTYLVEGDILYKGKLLQQCEMKVNVVKQSCPLPKYLKANCNNELCNFTCRDIRSTIIGPSFLHCGPNYTWNGTLPICKAQTHCPVLNPPNNGHVSCQGILTKAGFNRGTVCRLHCNRGWRQSNLFSICKRAVWSQALLCQRKHKKVTNPRSRS